MSLRELMADAAEAKRMAEDGWNERIMEFDECLVTVRFYCDVDWDYYSKTYRRNGGIPKKTYSKFQVIVSAKGREVTYPLESFRGNYLIEPIRKFFQIKPTKKVNGVQITKFHRIEEAKKVAGYRIYERYLAGMLYDYCIVSSLGVTFHSHEYRGLVEGIRQKIGTKDPRVKIYDLSLAKKLNFCDEGTNDFIDHYQLDRRKTYTKEKLRSAIFLDPSCALKYPGEILKLGLLTDEEKSRLKP